MTKPVDRKKSQNYLTKAEDLLQVARYALSQKKYDATVTSAVHSGINALDALTTHEKGLRASGEHGEILSLVKGILTPEEHGDITKQFSSLLDLKNAAQYQPDFTSQEEAKNSIKWAERILAKSKINYKHRDSAFHLIEKCTSKWQNFKTPIPVKSNNTMWVILKW